MGVAGIAVLEAGRLARQHFEVTSPFGHFIDLTSKVLHTAMTVHSWLWWTVDALVLGYLISLAVRAWRGRGSNALHLLTEAATAGLLMLATSFLLLKTLEVEPRLERVRNFYGTLSVNKDYDTGLENEYVELIHGGIIHGIQNLGDLYREEPITYYGRETGIGKALGRLRDQKDAKVGIVGLGAGTAACYAQAGHAFRFYEINPDVVRLARTHFTYLADAEKRGTTVDMIVGDARLMLEREPDQMFDVLLLDAFSSDAIPMHLLTREAFQIYHRHMKPDGIIAVHVTNTYLTLAPVVEKQAAAMGWRTTRVLTEESGDDDETDYVLITENEAFLKATPPDKPEDEQALDVPLWTDRYHNLFQILIKD